MIIIKVDVDIFKSGGGVRQDRIRRFLHSNEYGIIRSFEENPITYTMFLEVENPHDNVIQYLGKEFPEYDFSEDV